MKSLKGLMRHSITIFAMSILLSACGGEENIIGSKNFSTETQHKSPSIDPPVLTTELDSNLQRSITPQAPLADALTEWTFHKTADNAHPSGIEQQMMWFMNRARSNPTQEGIFLAETTDADVAGARSFFNVNLDTLKSEFASYAAKPPAAFDSRLYAAAKAHSDDLLARDAQDHNDQFARITTAGFKFSSVRGNVFSFTKSGIHGHSGWNIDWGNDGGDGSGVQTARGHRKAVMSLDGSYVNVGLAAVPGTGDGSGVDVGPIIATGNYASALTSVADHYNRFIVGTVWEDENGNSQYDPGEGISNVTVQKRLSTDGVAGGFFAITSDSGGYAIPVTEAGEYEVTFAGGGVNTSKTITIGIDSVLVDYKVEPTPVQTVTPNQSSFTVSPGDTVEFDVMYPAGNPSETTGLGVQLLYDSSKLSFESITTVYAIDRVSFTDTPVSDTGNDDGDLSTDSKLIAAWSETNGNWPRTFDPNTGTFITAPLPIKLFTVRFTASEGFTSDTVIKFTGDTAAGHDFASTPVTVTLTVDTVDPTITAPSDKVVEATGVTTFVPSSALGNPTVSDNADASPTVTHTETSALALGEHIIVWTVTDSAGNSATDNQKVTVVDTTAPVITAPTNITVPTTGATTAVNLGTPTVTDSVDSNPIVTANPSGPFAVGTHTVTWTATDASDNESTATQTVTILADSVVPTITAPADKIIEATGATTSVSDAILGNPTVRDNIDANPSVSHTSTSALALGEHIVTWTVTDSSDNVATATQKVTIVDTTAPTITAPADVTIATTGVTTVVDLGTPTVTDLVDSSPTATADPTGPFAVGTHTITWTATDASGNESTTTQSVTVIADSGAPTITAPADKTIEATGATTSVSDGDLGSPTVSDDIDANPSVSHSDTSALALGVHTVVWTATDSSDNSATADQKITVVDTTAPTITAPVDISVTKEGATTPVELGTPTLTDSVDSNPTATADPVGPFAVGTHTVTWTAVDAEGNSSTATQIVTVIDLNAVTILDVQVDSSSDDAEEYISGQVKLNSSDLELSDAPESNSQAVGIRFNDINVPVGAIISNAYVQFTVDETSAGATSLNVYGEANANPTTFTTDNSDITSRPLTTANTSWNPASWDTVGDNGAEQQTEDISAIIQELVNQSGWNEGQSMAIIIVGEGSRTAESFDGDSAGAATLHIEYSTDGNPAPIANLIATPQTGNAPLTVNFDASGSTDNGAITQYDWDFGDASDVLDGGSTISHDYKTPGDYTVAVTVTDDEGKTATTFIAITVVDPNAPTALEIQVNSGSDDAEEASNGSVNLTSSDLELTQESSTQTIGIRFTDINLPQGALISNAYIQFQVDETASGTTQLTVNGEASGNPVTFSSTRNNITTRPLTSASADWSPEAWPNANVKGVAQQTSDLSAIVQELVNQASWDSGQAMAFIINGNGKRVAESFNGSTEGAPTLHIEYTTDGNPAPVANMVVTPTSGNATLNVTFDGSGSTDNGSITRYDWDFGDGSDDLDSDSTVSHSYPTPGTYTATLTVVDDEGKTATSSQVITVIDPNQPTTLDVKVNSSSDDAEEFGNGTMYLDSSDLELTQDSSSQTVGMRFNGVNIPIGAAISRAYIQFQVDETSNVDSGLAVYGEANANPTTFTSNSGDITSRPRTSASTFWIPVAWEQTGERGIDQQTPDISAIVQELVSQSGWNSGQSMVFIINGDGKRVAESYDGSTEGAPTLHIEYSTDGNPTPIANIVASPETGNATLDVSFDGSGSTDDGSITQYDWDFGDSTASASGATVNHSYATPGTYTATLTVTDDGDKTAVTSVVITVTDPNTPTTLDIQVDSSEDDAEELSDSEMYLDSSDLELIDSPESNNQTIGLRFNQIALPLGAIVTKAYIQFTTDETDSGETDLTIYGDSNTNPAAFTEANADMSNRTLTTASSNWTPAGWSTVGEQGVDQRSSDISNIIQELVDQSGWNSRQSMAFIIKGTGKRVAESFDGSSEGAPILHIEYRVHEGLSR